MSCEASSDQARRGLEEFTTLYHTLLETPTVLEAAYKQEGLTPADTLTAPPPKPTVEA